MPRYAYQKPVNRLYSYNLGYMNNYYKPLTTYIETKQDSRDVIEKKQRQRAPSEQPGHQSLAERLKSFPMDGTTYRSRASSLPPTRRRFIDDDEVAIAKRKASKALALRSKEIEESTTKVLSSERDSRARRASTYDTRVEIGDDDVRYVPIWMKHPYRLPEEDVRVPPHESSIWPESVPHFNLVSSYDAMIGYLGLKQRKMFR